MKTLRLDTVELGLDFNAALKLATAIAEQRLGEETMLLSWCTNWISSLQAGNAIILAGFETVKNSCS